MLAKTHRSLGWEEKMCATFLQMSFALLLKDLRIVVRVSPSTSKASTWALLLLSLGWVGSRERRERSEGCEHAVRLYDDDASEAHGIALRSPFSPRDALARQEPLVLNPLLLPVSVGLLHRVCPAGFGLPARPEKMIRFGGRQQLPFQREGNEAEGVRICGKVG